MFEFLKRKVLKNKEEKEGVVKSSIIELNENKKNFANLKTLSEKDIEDIQSLYKHNEVMLQDGHITNANKCIEECDNNIAIIDKCLIDIDKQLNNNSSIKSRKFVKYNDELKQILLTLRDNYIKAQERREKLLSNIQEDRKTTKDKKYKENF